MKKIIPFFIFVMVLADGFGQHVGKIALIDIQSKLINVEIIRPAFKKKCRVYGDYGQEDRREYLKDEKGEPIEFERPITALNYLESLGFTLISVNSGGGESINQFTHYLFRRKE